MNTAWDNPEYPPLVQSIQDRWSLKDTWAEERAILSFYRHQDLAGLKKYVTEYPEESYWGWQRIIKARQNEQGFDDMPYLLWAGIMFHPWLWGTLPVIKNHIKRFLREEFPESSHSLKISFFDSYFTEKNWTRKYQNELFRIATMFWKENGSERKIVVKNFYALLVEQCSRDMAAKTFDVNFFAWLVSSNYLVNKEQKRQGKPFLLSIMKNGSAELVSSIIPELLNHQEYHHELLDALKERDDELSAPVEWLEAMFSGAEKPF